MNDVGSKQQQTWSISNKPKMESSEKICELEMHGPTFMSGSWRKEQFGRWDLGEVGSPWGSAHDAMWDLSPAITKEYSSSVNRQEGHELQPRAPRMTSSQKGPQEDPPSLLHAFVLQKRCWNATQVSKEQRENTRIHSPLCFRTFSLLHKEMLPF